MIINLIIKNGTLVTPSGIYKADIAIHDQKILAIGSCNAFSPSERTIDAAGKLVFPGAIDTHTHFELAFMGETSPESWDKGTIAAAFGGTTTIVDFAIQEKGASLMSAVEMKLAQADKLSAIDFAFHGCFTDFSDIAQVKSEIGPLVDYGIASFKEFMIYSKEGWMINDWNLFTVLREAKKFGAVVGVHAENASIGESWMEQLVQEGKVSAEYHPKAKPNFVEAEAIQRAISIAEFAGARLYIVHMSTREGVELVKTAKSRGLPVYSETCTHYLTFNDDVYSRPDGINYIISPPLRKNDDIDSLWQGIKNRSVLITGSDHAAYALEQKEKNSETFVTVPNGAGGVEVRFPILYSEGVRKRGLSLIQLVDVCCTNAAKLLGMYPKKGALAPESDADVVIFDPNLEKTLRCDDLHMGSDYTIYEGMKVTGYPITVISKGNVIVEDEAYIGKIGNGEYIKRNINDEIIDSL